MLRGASCTHSQDKDRAFVQYAVLLALVDVAWGVLHEFTGYRLCICAKRCSSSACRCCVGRPARIYRIKIMLLCNMMFLLRLLMLRGAFNAHSHKKDLCEVTIKLVSFNGMMQNQS